MTDLFSNLHWTRCFRTLPKHERLVDLHGSVIDHTYGGGSSIAVLLIMERLHRDLYTGLKVKTNTADIRHVSGGLTLSPLHETPSRLGQAGLSLRERLQIALDVVEGIRFLHSQGLLHRDIKLKNVLVSADQPSLPVPRPRPRRVEPPRACDDKRPTPMTGASDLQAVGHGSGFRLYRV